MRIAIDVDGTVMMHEYPGMGAEVPHAIHWIKEFKKLGAKIFLNTMRGRNTSCGNRLDEVIAWFRERDIEVDGINQDPHQIAWTDSNKCDADLYIDDKGFGIPLVRHPDIPRPYVNWAIVGPEVATLLKENPQT